MSNFDRSQPSSFIFPDLDDSLWHPITRIGTSPDGSLYPDENLKNWIESSSSRRDKVRSWINRGVYLELVSNFEYCYLDIVEDWTYKILLNYTFGLEPEEIESCLNEEFLNKLRRLASEFYIGRSRLWQEFSDTDFSSIFSSLASWRGGENDLSAIRKFSRTRSANMKPAVLSEHSVRVLSDLLQSEAWNKEISDIKKIFSKDSDFYNFANDAFDRRNQAAHEPILDELIGAPYLNSVRRTMDDLLLNLEGHYVNLLEMAVFNNSSIHRSIENVLGGNERLCFIYNFKSNVKSANGGDVIGIFFPYFYKKPFEEDCKYYICGDPQSGEAFSFRIDDLNLREDSKIKSIGKIDGAAYSAIATVRSEKGKILENFVHSHTASDSELICFPIFNEVGDVLFEAKNSAE